MISVKVSSPVLKFTNEKGTIRDTEQRQLCAELEAKGAPLYLPTVYIKLQLGYFYLFSTKT